MLKYLNWCIWTLVLSVVFSTALNAQANFVYTNNDPYNAPNSVSAFSVDDPSLCATAGSSLPCQISGSPFLTGGNGTASTVYSPNRIIVVNDFLYASNAGSNTVSAFSISPSTGYLTPVAGSPFATNSADGIPSGISLASTPDGKYLYAGSTGGGGQITVFAISSSGALTMVPSSGGFANPFPAGGPMSSMKVSPDGKFLAVALFSSIQVAMFSIQGDGTLTAVPGSPFEANVGDFGTYIYGIDINCSSDRLFAGRNGPDIDIFDIAQTGVLSEAAGLPFSTSPSPSSNWVVSLSHPDDSTLFSSNPGGNTVTAFAVGADGSLTFVGSTPAAGNTGLTIFSGPAGLALSRDGTFLYGADKSITGGVGAISTFDFTNTTPPTPPTSPTAPMFYSLTHPIPNPFPTGQISGLNSLAAYPPNVCSTSNGGTTPKLTVTKTLVPSADPRRFNLQINGTTVEQDVGDGGTTGPQDGVIGTNTVGEVGMPGVDLSNFNVVIGGDCAPDGSITLEAGDNKTCTITNTRKVPTLTSIDPNSAILGGSGFTASLTGTNFGADSTVQFDGSDLTTHYTSPDTTHLTADVPASDLMTVGHFPITVHNSLPTVGASNSLTFTVSYKFPGLLPPYAGGGRPYRVNSTVPLKWQYAAADGTPVPSPDANPIVEVYPAEGCGEAHTGDLLPIETAGNSGYAYHPGSNTWQFNWKTSGMEAGCYVIYIKSLQTGQTNGPFPIRLVK